MNTYINELPLKEKIEKIKKWSWDFDIEAFLNELDGYEDGTIDFFVNKLINGDFDYYKDYRDFLNDVYIGDTYEIIEEVLNFVNKNRDITVIDSVWEFCHEYFTDYVFMPFEGGLLVFKNV